MIYFLIQKLIRMKFLITVLITLASFTILKSQTGLIVETQNTAEVATFQCLNSVNTQIDFLGNYSLNGTGYNSFKRAYISANNQNFRLGLSNNNVNGTISLWLEVPID